MLTTPIKHSRAQLLPATIATGTPSESDSKLRVSLYQSKESNLLAKKGNANEENEYRLPFNPQKNDLERHLCHDCSFSPKEKAATR